MNIKSKFNVRLALMPFLLLSGLASAASTVTVDGILSTNEYSGPNSGTDSLLWWNGHESVYTLPAGNMNNLNWEINDLNGLFSLNIFVEVPTYARRMIWAKDCEYKGSGTDSDCDVIPGEYLDAYQNGSHHIKDGVKKVKMDYGTQTESEYFELSGLTGKIKWQDEDGGSGQADDFGDYFNWATSREYLLDSGKCTEDLCLEFDMTSSLELMWLGLESNQAALDKLASITDMELHLSDEARGLPPIPPVPVPAAIWLFGTALVGFIGMSRRRKIS
jgi:hypothetical protein